MFTHLHVHSAFSLLEGGFSIAQLMVRLEQMQLPVLALTDTNGLYGATTFYRCAKQMGIKPIIGTCLKSEDGEAVLLAKDREGFAQISQIVTARHMVERFSLRKDLKKIAYTSDPHIFVLSRDEALLADLAVCWDRDHLFAELVRNNTQRGNERQLRRLRTVAEQLRIGVVATNDVHFLHPQDFLIHRLMTAIGKQSHVQSGQLPLSSEDSWLKPPEAMEALFADIPEARNSTTNIAEECNLDLGLGKYTFPQFPVDGGGDSREFLTGLCAQGLRHRYGGDRLPEAVRRMERELEVIRQLGFTDYFLVVWDLLQYAGQQNIHWVGRGSAANSIVSYALRITNVDPIRYNLFFERFLNPGRESPPDIDLDFGWKERDRILSYVYDRWGHDRVAMICTYVTYTTRLAVREIGKALGLPDEEITAISTRIPYMATAKTLLEDKNQYPETRELPLDEEPYRTILQLAAHIYGYPRHLSIHAGGIVIAPYPITRMVPLQRAAKGFVVTQYDMYGIEDIGLVKIDLLAQRSLSVFDDVLNVLRSRGEDAEAFLRDIDAVEQDAGVQDLIRTGNTIGCFYVESPSMRGLLQKLRVSTFEDLTAASSVIRPGVAESGMMQQYVRRKNGEEPASYLHPRMEPLLRETCGVMIYQEDVIRVAHEIAGISLAQGDLLRRAMSGKERSPEKMEQLRNDFITRAEANGVDSDIAREIWRQISSFAAYAFSKAHSASYAQLSLQVLYLRAHHPADFMAAVLNNHGGYYTTMAYIEESRRMGLRILLPDVCTGSLDFRAEDPRSIRVGLSQVKGIAQKHWDSFLAERTRNPFESFTDFLLRTEFIESEVETLIKCGACDSFGNTRPQMLWLLKSLYSSIAQQRQHCDLTGPAIIRTPSVPRLRECSMDQKLAWEMDTLEVTVSRHPLHLFKPWKQAKGCTPAKLLPDFKGEYVKVIGWLVTTKGATTKKGEQMLFITFEDTEAIFEITMFPRAYQRYAHLLINRGPYVVEGKVEEDHGVFTINLEHMRNLGRARRYEPIYAELHPGW